LTVGSCRKDTPYHADIARKLTKKRPKSGAHLADLRQKAGLTQQELADILDVHQQTIAYWEQSDKPPRSEVLLPMAKALGVPVEVLLDPEAKPERKKSGPKGKVQKLFEDLSQLPRRQQDKVVEVVAAFISQQKASR